MGKGRFEQAEGGSFRHRFSVALGRRTVRDFNGFERCKVEKIMI